MIRFHRGHRSLRSSHRALSDGLSSRGPQPSSSSSISSAANHFSPTDLPPTPLEPLLPSACPPRPYLGHHSPDDDADSYVLLVPIRRRLRRGCSCHCVAPLLASLALLALVFLLWPSDPQVSVARLQLEHVSVVARPAVAVNISAALKLRVRNPDLFALDYSRLDIDIGYRGRPLGRVSSGGGGVRARATSYVDADLELNGIQVVEDAIYLLEDLVRGSIPFDAVVEVKGHLHFFCTIPVQGDFALMGARRCCRRPEVVLPEKDDLLSTLCDFALFEYFVCCRER